MGKNTVTGIIVPGITVAAISISRPISGSIGKPEYIIARIVVKTMRMDDSSSVTMPVTTLRENIILVRSAGINPVDTLVDIPADTLVDIPTDIPVDIPAGTPVDIPVDTPVNMGISGTTTTTITRRITVLFWARLYITHYPRRR
jgi:hypothetical protein